MSSRSKYVGPGEAPVYELVQGQAYEGCV